MSQATARGHLTRGAERSRQRRRSQLTAYLYLVPALMIIGGITYVGVFYSIWVSTLDWNGLDPNPGRRSR